LDGLGSFINSIRIGKVIGCCVPADRGLGQVGGYVLGVPPIDWVIIGA